MLTHIKHLAHKEPLAEFLPCLPGYPTLKGHLSYLFPRRLSQRVDLVWPHVWEARPFRQRPPAGPPSPRRSARWGRPAASHPAAGRPGSQVTPARSPSVRTRPGRRSAHAHGAAPRPHRAPAPNGPNAAHRAMEPAEVGVVLALLFGRSGALPP